MADEFQAFEPKHLARNVPRYFDECVERQRLALVGDGRRSRHPSPHLKQMLQILGAKSESENQLGSAITEIRLRYLVVQKTLDFSVPPTPIRNALSSLTKNASGAVRKLEDEDRDRGVRNFLGLEEHDEILGTKDAFLAANTMAERAAIARQIVLNFMDEIQEVAEFFDYKAEMTPRGNGTQFANIYAVNALAALFESENGMERKATINRNIPRNSDAKFDAGPLFTSPFFEFVTAFYRMTDDAQFSHHETTSFRDRIRDLTILRKSDPDLHVLLAGNVTVEETLEFMNRSETIGRKAR